MRASARLQVSPTPSSFFSFVTCAEKNQQRYFAAALSRLLQSLQNFGQVAPFSVLPAVFVSFHSAAHFFWRSRAASWPALGSVFGFAVCSDALDCCANAGDERGSSGAVSNPAASRATKLTLYMTVLPLDGFQARTETVGLNRTTWFAQYSRGL